MAKMLIAVDGSPHSRRAVEQALRLGQSPEMHLLNVQIPIQSGHARMFVGREDLQDYYREEGLAALQEARAILDAAGVPYTHHIAVGHVAQTIAAYAKEKGFDQIVLGSHGRGALTHLLLGSVASDVLRLAELPVTLVK
ncbi:MAG: universal stress protein [Burkholderiales bacterium]|nr:universal stress protein [Burkholderiales bacterium]